MERETLLWATQTARPHGQVSSGYAARRLRVSLSMSLVLEPQKWLADENHSSTAAHHLAIRNVEPQAAAMLLGAAKLHVHVATYNGIVRLGVRSSSEGRQRMSD